jgi:poly-gamma-glutamate capsule biosynthesis protein CapA/YwtB (metallophosphatase superfamily)
MITAALRPSGGPPSPQTSAVRLFLCGDVMTGRGIDQVLPHPCDPALHEDFVQSAALYVHLAEDAHGPIARPVTPDYIWGAALDELRQAMPDASIINLETSITRSEDYAPKGINYRMSPENADCLTAAPIDCCVLANNHVLDWGRAGLLDTLTTLQRSGIRSAGAGRNQEEAAEPAVLPLRTGGRVLVYSYAALTSGTPRNWAAGLNSPGVNLLTEPSERGAAQIAERITRERKSDDIVVVSLHWGPNWGYEISDRERRFAHILIEHADVSVVHGHSSHHPKGIEIHQGRLILYGCGDFINDYEGIAGYEDYRGDLVLMYFADIVTTSHDLVDLDMVPLQINRFRLTCPSDVDMDWMRRRLDRECHRLGAGVATGRPGRLKLSWHAAPDARR